MNGVPSPYGASRLVRASELRARPEPRWLVAHTFPDRGVGQIYGPTYSGKTYITLDLALSVANGHSEWFDRAIGRSGPVVYVLMEGSWDFGRRVAAWLLANGGTDADLWVLDEQPLNLADEASLAQFLADVRAAGIDPALVVIDTQSLATSGVEENSNTEMTLVMANLKRLSRDLGCLVLTVHHTGHDTSRSRGASAQKAALDVEVSVVGGVVKADKVKAYMPWEAGEAFRIESAGDSATVVRERTVLGVIQARPGSTCEETAKLLRRRVADVRAELTSMAGMGVVHHVRNGRRIEFFAGPGQALAEAA